MVSEKNNIFVDASFFEGIDGSKDLITTFISPEIQYPGRRNIATDIVFESTDEAFTNSIVTLEVATITSGTEDNPVILYLVDSSITYLNNLTQYRTGTILSGTTDILVDYRFLGFFSSGAKKNIVTSVIVGDEFVRLYNIYTSLIILPIVTYNKDVITDYTNYTGYNDYYDVPIINYYGYCDNDIFYYTPSGSLVDFDKIVEVSFAGWISYSTTGNIICSLQNTCGNLINIELGSGNKTGMGISCISSIVAKNNYLANVICSLLDIKEMLCNVETVSGIKTGIDINVLSSTQVTDVGCLVDITMFPIYFNNFTVSIGEYVSSNELICVEAHDGFYNLIASGTYFKLNDVLVDHTLTPISDGYKICYNSPDNFLSLKGIIKFTAHAENDNGDFLEEDYYLTFGYIVAFDNKDWIGLDYGFNTKVGVRLSSENLSECPSISSEGYWFNSEQHPTADLGATIVGKGKIRETKALGATIYPESTAYFYNKQFRVVVTAKDFNGNIMAPCVLEFKIRNDS